MVNFIPLIKCIFYNLILFICTSYFKTPWPFSFEKLGHRKCIHTYHGTNLILEDIRKQPTLHTNYQLLIKCTLIIFILGWVTWKCTWAKFLGRNRNLFDAKKRFTITIVDYIETYICYNILLRKYHIINIIIYNSEYFLHQIPIDWLID